LILTPAPNGPESLLDFQNTTFITAQFLETKQGSYFILDTRQQSENGEHARKHLARDSVINVSQPVPLDRTVLRDCVGQANEVMLELLDRGLLIVLGLPR
jgi:mRNA-degrading endonuclease toxin of MazEF toxin-antitoxin module